MRFVKFDVVTGEDGKTINLPINPEQVGMLTPIVIPTGLMGGPSGDIPITKPGTGISIGVKVVPVVGEIKEIQKLLEEGAEEEMTEKKENCKIIHFEEDKHDQKT